MASNSFGNIFRITTWGESHGSHVGVVIDGCPAGIAITVDEINTVLAARAPGNNPFVSTRKEPDVAQIVSGVFQGVTTGAPISILIANQDADSSKYEVNKHLFKPGHGQYTYQQKYGIVDYRGGGRASARETAARVAASAIAQKILATANIKVAAFLSQVGEVKLPEPCAMDYDVVVKNKAVNLLPCPDQNTALAMQQQIADVLEKGDSVGGIVSCITTPLPIGLGEPIYQKLEALLAYAMLSLPASKGFAIGEGFAAASMFGSSHNDELQQGDVAFVSNHAGGTLAGISNGMPLYFSVPFKPTSSIKKTQATIDVDGNAALFKLAEGSRHDPCVAIRAVPVVKAMCELVLADLLLQNRLTQL